MCARAQPGLASIPVCFRRAAHAGRNLVLFHFGYPVIAYILKVSSNLAVRVLSTVAFKTQSSDENM